MIWSKKKFFKSRRICQFDFKWKNVDNLRIFLINRFIVLKKEYFFHQQNYSKDLFKMFGMLKCKSICLWNQTLKHVKVHCHFIWEKVLQEKIELKHIRIKNQVAYLLTKSLNNNKFQNFYHQQIKWKLVLRKNGEEKSNLWSSIAFFIIIY